MGKDCEMSDEYTKAAKDRWSAVAKGWRDWAPTFEAAAARVNETLIRQAGLKPGMLLLDLASGAG